MRSRVCRGMAAFATTLLLAGCQTTMPPRFLARSCAPAVDAPRVECGVVDVAEDRSRPHGRHIGLNVVVLRALGAPSGPAAQFFIDGGPGLAATEASSFFAGEGVAYRTQRDVVLVDMRGTGGSNALRCQELEQSPREPMYPVDRVKACAASLQAHADLRQYSTAAAAEDIEAVRQALGYRQIDLNAVSYGTTLAMRYIAEHPQQVRTAVLYGTVPADRTPPRFHATAAERGLQLLLQACAKDRACSSGPTPLEASLQQAVDRLPPAQRPLFMERLRTRLYSPASSRSVPSMIRQAAAGQVPEAAGDQAFADGLYLSITCAESLARMPLEESIEAARATRFGAYRLERQRDACAVWPRAPRDERLFETPASDVPVLLISGALDPVSPPEWADQAAKRFSNATHWILPHSAHVPDGLSKLDTCLDANVLRFVAQRSSAGLDLSCADQMKPEAFSP